MRAKQGSAYYTSSSNFFVYGGGGQKADWEGHDNHWFNNVLGFPGGLVHHNGYGGQIGSPGKGVLDGHNHIYSGNKAVLGYSKTYAKPICSGPGASVLSNNLYWTADGTGSSDCPAGFETNGTVAAFTSTMDDDLIQFAREVLW